MSDENNFKNYKTIEEFSKTIEGSNYFHDLYLKAVNNPIRREILVIVNRERKISHINLFQILFENEIISEESLFIYNIDYLIKALCIDKIKENDVIYYSIMQAGRVIEYLK